MRREAIAGLSIFRSKSVCLRVLTRSLVMQARWNLHGSTTCQKSGSITVTNPVAPPIVTLVNKASPPFKIVVTGANLQRGIRVFIDEMEWTGVVWKKDTKIQLTGSALKATVPKGTTRTFRFVNPDGGEASHTWGW